MNDKEWRHHRECAIDLPPLGLCSRMHSGAIKIEGQVPMTEGQCQNWLAVQRNLSQRERVELFTSLKALTWQKERTEMDGVTYSDTVMNCTYCGTGNLYEATGKYGKQLVDENGDVHFCAGVKRAAMDKDVQPVNGRTVMSPELIRRLVEVANRPAQRGKWRQFARQYGVSVDSLRHWRKKLGLMPMTQREQERQ